MPGDRTLAHCTFVFTSLLPKRNMNGSKVLCTLPLFPLPLLKHQHKICLALLLCHLFPNTLTLFLVIF